MEVSKFLTEEPASKDEFAGGHQRVASSLASVITSNELSSNMIALEGGLGSGKSTVLSLLEKDLPGEKYSVFTFDCFKHKNGPIRRAFFELLHDFILQSNEKKEKELKDLLYRSTGRYEEQQGVVDNKITWGTLTWATLLPLSGAALISLNSARSNDLNELGLLLVLFLPALLLIISILVSAFPSISCWLTDNLKVDMSFKSGVVKGAKVTLSDKDVTSTDLQKYCSRFLDYSKTKVVVVLDNVDRLENDELLDVWSDMDIFRQAANDGHWVVVPYCQSVIERAVKSINPKDDARMTPQDFVNKWFSVKFRVPPLLLSDWRSYFIDCCRYSLPELPEEDGQRMLSIYRYNTQEKDITPR